MFVGPRESRGPHLAQRWRRLFQPGCGSGFCSHGCDVQPNRQAFYRVQLPL